MDAIVARLAAAKRPIPVGLNLGANKTSTDRAADFAAVMEAARDHVDFATVNVSSPNTERLRDLQGKEALAALLEGVMAVRANTPVMLKIAPDLSEAEIADVAQVATDAGVAAIIATNTTLSREGLKSYLKREAGGHSRNPPGCWRACQPTLMCRSSVSAASATPIRPTPRSAQAHRRCSSILRWFTAGCRWWAPSRAASTRIWRVTGSHRSRMLSAAGAPTGSRRQRPAPARDSARQG
jgi:cytochrome c553